VPKLLERFGDAFDFVDIVFDRATVANRYHYVVRNAVSGIGLGANDLGIAYGSAARLKGITVFPGMTFFDAGARAHSHELGHVFHTQFFHRPTPARLDSYFPYPQCGSDLFI